MCERVSQPHLVGCLDILYNAPSTARSARMSKVAKNWKGELFERRIVLDELLQEGDSAGRGSDIFAGLAEAAEIEERVDSRILNLL